MNLQQLPHLLLHGTLVLTSQRLERFDDPDVSWPTPISWPLPTRSTGPVHVPRESRKIGAWGSSPSLPRILKVGSPVSVPIRIADDLFRPNREGKVRSPDLWENAVAPVSVIGTAGEGVDELEVGTGVRQFGGVELGQ